jgi:hypothetical protein
LIADSLQLKNQPFVFAVARSFVCHSAFFDLSFRSAAEESAFAFRRHPERSEGPLYLFVILSAAQNLRRCLCRCLFSCLSFRSAAKESASVFCSSFLAQLRISVVAFAVVCSSGGSLGLQRLLKNSVLLKGTGSPVP